MQKKDSNPNISKLFQKIRSINLTSNNDYLQSYAVAARTYYPNSTFENFEKTNINVIPFVAKPFIPIIQIKENWNEWKNYYTKKLERSPSWNEIVFQLPEKKSVSNQLIYSLDLHKKKEKYNWSNDYSLCSIDNIKYWKR